MRFDANFGQFNVETYDDLATFALTVRGGLIARPGTDTLAIKARFQDLHASLCLPPHTRRCPPVTVARRGQINNLRIAA